MARPQKPEREKRDTWFKVRVTPAERAAIQARAQAAHLTPSDYARRMLINGRVEVREAATLPFPAITELNRIGVNLNQMTRVANASGNIPAGLATLLERLNTLLDEAMGLEDIEADAEALSEIVEG